MNTRHMDIIFALIFIVVFGGAILVSLGFPDPALPGDPGAAFFPQLISVASLIFCFILMIQRIFLVKKDQKKDADKIDAGLGSFIIISASVAGLILAMRFLGSEIAFFLFLFILLGQRTNRWVWSLWVSLVSSAIIYVIFVALLNVHLPVLFLPKYITF